MSGPEARPLLLVLVACAAAVDADAAARSLGVPREELLSRERCGIYLS